MSATREDVPEDVAAALEHVRRHLHHATNYSEERRHMALRYLRWVVKPVPKDATLTECGMGHRIRRILTPGASCPVCVGWEEA